MALLLRNEFPEADIDKVISMCIVHDLGECFTGDIPTFVKTDKDRNVEDELLTNWINSLPCDVAPMFSSLFAEMNEQKTLESKIFKALDKIEAVIQHNEAPISSWSENEYELNKTHGFDVVEFSSWLRDLRKEVLDETLRIIDDNK